MRKIISSIAVLALLAAPAAASAQGGGGNAGVDEYTETIPNGGGNNPSADPGDGSGPLTPAQESALEAQGPDGAAAANLAQNTGPDRSDGASANNPSDENSGGPSGGNGSGITDVVGDITGGSDSGMGLALPIILGAALLGAIAIVIMRRGGGSTDPA